MREGLGESGADRALGGSAGRLLPSGRAGRDDPDRLGAGGAGRWSRRVTGRSSSAGRIRWSGSSCPELTEFFLDDTRPRRSSRTSRRRRCSRRETVAAPDPDRGRERHPRDEPGRPARQAALDRARDPIRRAAREKRWVLTQYPDRRLRRRRRDEPGRLRGVRRLGDVPRPARPGRGLAGAGPAAGGAGRVHDGREDGPDRGRRDRPDALGRRPDLDQLRRPAEHALRRDLHRAGRETRPRPAPVRVPGLPRRPRA